VESLANTYHYISVKRFENGEKMIYEIPLFIFMISVVSYLIWIFLKWITKKYFVEWSKIQRSDSTREAYKTQSASEEIRIRGFGLINSVIFLLILLSATCIFSFINNIEIKNLLILIGLFFNFIGSLFFVFFGSFEPETYYKRYLVPDEGREVPEVLEWAKRRNILLFTGLFIFIFGFLIILINTAFTQF